MASLAATVMKALQDAGVPAVGVSLGEHGRKTSWRVDFATSDDTQENHDKAGSVIAAFDLEAARKATGE